MPKKKKKNGPSKSDFVRSQPSTLSAADVVARAKKAGMTITAGLVYTVRAVEKAKAAKGAKPKKSAPAATAAKSKKAAGGKPTASESSGWASSHDGLGGSSKKANDERRVTVFCSVEYMS